MGNSRLALLAVAMSCGWAVRAPAQVIGSYDNFDCFNDTGQPAEGFEIDIEDIDAGDLTREFPSNFSSTPWVIRYGLPSVTSYDWTVASPDAEHAYDAGHKGVLVTWAARWNGTHWVAKYCSQPFGASKVAGNKTLYRASPTLTNGDSCWYYGLGAAYPNSGCEHFGISFAYGVVPGRISYHWKLPDAANIGHLVNGPLEASLPPSPVLGFPPPQPGQPVVVHVVAEAPEHEPDPALNPDLQFGTAYWVKVTTLYSPNPAVLDDLQKQNVQAEKVVKRVHWAMLQRPPRLDPAAAESEDEADDRIPQGAVQVTKQYEYFKFKGAYDSEDHSALCNPAVRCKTPTKTTYTVQSKGHGGGTVIITGGDLGGYLGAHVNAEEVQ